MFINNNKYLVIIGIHPADRADVCVCKLRSATVRWSLSSLQRPDHHQARGVCRCVHATCVCYQDETASRTKRVLPIYAGTSSVVSKKVSSKTHGPGKKCLSV